MSDFLMSSANFLDTEWAALVSDFNFYGSIMKPFIEIAKGASDLLGMFA
ncbi:MULTISPECIES: hypothetical protein [Corynebacterium]|uniref:Porin n=2 Tax=Corynebacterium TaxID=1716 RepID=A0A8I1HXW3_9CORY|nr:MULTISPECIES: hypothetical protein [Corynebacterium]EFQ80890.1 hypothetical protein HMPREF0305_10892 [Corynebacterium pseudogenitalium ATCC 33035]MBK3427977.1 hypothetical protein [Corynebacterium tuberculostearicum]